MSKILSTALLVSCATAQLTTSAWMPGTGDMDVEYYGSVISAKDDRTTLSLSLKGISDLTAGLVDNVAQTITVAGNTYYGFQGSAAAQGITVTVVGECSRQNTDEESATCTISTKGYQEAMSSMCSEAGASEEMCASGALDDTNTSTVVPEGYFTMAPIVVTAGEDLLPSASAAASLSVGSASATASPSGFSKSPKPTASGSEAAASSGASKTSQPSPQSTNAAPLMTMAPALAGLGAAAAFFL